MTVSLSWSDEETKDLFPLHICVARRDPNNEDADVGIVSLKLNYFIFLMLTNFLLYNI